VIWPEEYDPKTSAICALNDIAAKAPLQLYQGKNGERTNLVTGATGRQGGAAYQRLRKTGFRLRVLVRDPDGNQAHQLMGYGEDVFQGNLDDPDRRPSAAELRTIRM